MKQQNRPGFRTSPKKGKAKPPSKVVQENPTKTAPQIYAHIPGHQIAEVVEMVYSFKGRRRKLDYIVVIWPEIGPQRRRFKKTPFIRLKKRKKKSKSFLLFQFFKRLFFKKATS